MTFPGRFAMDRRTRSRIFIDVSSLAPLDYLPTRISKKACDYNVLLDQEVTMGSKPPWGLFDWEKIDIEAAPGAALKTWEPDLSNRQACEKPTRVSFVGPL